MGGGAWPFLVGGAICLVNSVNERDLGLLNSRANPSAEGGYGPGGVTPVPSLPREGGGGGGRPSGRPPVGFVGALLRGTMQSQCMEVRGNNRSVMPFRCSGPHARYTDELNERRFPLGRKVRAILESSSCWG